MNHQKNPKNKRLDFEKLRKQYISCKKLKTTTQQKQQKRKEKK